MTTYFVKTGGDDDADGLSDANAWATLSKVNGETFSAGDVIQLNRGDVWREQLTPPSSGSDGSPITFQAYGTGDDPKITGVDEVSTWTLHSGSVYSATFDNPIDTFLVLEDGVHLRRQSGALSTLLDNFNRTNTPSNESPAGWTEGIKGGTTGLEINSNVLKLGSPYSGTGSAYWNDGTVAQSLGVGASIATPTGNFNEMALFLGLANIGASVDGYEIRLTKDGSGNGQVFLYRLDNGTRTQVGSTANLGVNPASGDQLRAYRSGNNIVVDFKDGAADWANILSESDTTYTADGFIGLSIENNTGQWDDFSTAQATIPITDSGQFFADDTSDTIYVRCTDDADPDTHTMEIGARYYTVNADDRQYLTFDNLWLHGGGGEFGAGFKCQPQSTVPQDITLQNCRISHSYYAGVWFEHKDGEDGLSDLTLDTCEVDNNRLRGVFINGEDATARFTGVVLDGCNVHDNGNNTDGLHGVWIVLCDGPEVTGCTIDDNTGSLDWSSGLYIENTINAVVTDNTADSNKSNYHFDVNPNGFTCTHNVSTNATLQGFWIEEHVDTNGTSLLAHNTSYKDLRGIYFGPGGGGITEVSGVETKNNIVSQAELSAIGFDASQGGDIEDFYTDNDMDFNGYSVQEGGAICETVTPNAEYTLAEWQVESSLEADSIDFDDSLADPDNGDFTLDAGSNAIDAGEEISGIPFNGSAPDLGAFETVAAIATSLLLLLGVG